MLSGREGRGTRGSAAPEGEAMRKRFALLWAMVVLALALMIPATTAAATYGQMTFVKGYCSGPTLNTVNATFKLTKYSGFHATRLVMVVKGQGYYNGR